MLDVEEALLEHVLELAPRRHRLHLRPSNLPRAERRDVWSCSNALDLRDSNSISRGRKDELGKVRGRTDPKQRKDETEL